MFSQSVSLGICMAPLYDSTYGFKALEIEMSTRLRSVSVML